MVIVSDLRKMPIADVSHKIYVFNTPPTRNTRTSSLLWQWDVAASCDEAHGMAAHFLSWRLVTKSWPLSEKRLSVVTARGWSHPPTHSGESASRDPNAQCFVRVAALGQLWMSRHEAFPTSKINLRNKTIKQSTSVSRGVPLAELLFSLRYNLSFLLHW